MDNLKLSKFYIMEGLIMKTITKTAAIGISCLILMTFPVSAETIPTENDNLNNDTVYIDGVQIGRAHV